LIFPGARVVDAVESEASYFKVRQRLLDVSPSFKYPYIKTEELLDKESGKLVARLEMVANQFLITLPEEKNPNQFLKEVGPQVTSIHRISQSKPIYRVTLSETSLESLPAALKKVEEVSQGAVVGEPDCVAHTTQRPANPAYYDQWGLWKVNDFDFSKKPYSQLIDRYVCHFENLCLQILALQLKSKEPKKNDLFDIKNDFSSLKPWPEYQFGLTLLSKIASMKEPDSNEEDDPVDVFSSKVGINAEEGWDVRTSAESVVVAVVDTGIRYTHYNLQNNIWHNPNPDPKLNDCYGINFAPSGVDSINGDPSDDSGHGTHCAGIIGGEMNPSLGISGVAWRVQLMACKVLNKEGIGVLSDIISGFDYAKEHHADVINASLGVQDMVCVSGPQEGNTIHFGGAGYGALKTELKSLQESGVILVVASANNGLNFSDPKNHLPDDYGNTWTFESEPASYSMMFDNIISVAATDCFEYLEEEASFKSGEHLAWYSNCGSSVSLAAPGTFILSTFNLSDDSYAIFDGTSMATPCVAGAVALMKAEFPTWTHQELIKHLIETTDHLPSLKGKMQGGRLNLARALRPTPPVPTPPSGITPPPPLPPLNLSIP
ncbi:MAG: S8 family serine peptidase, partial [Chthoniobacterales bacterium]